MSEKDVKDASAGVLQDLKRFQLEKEEDLKRYMVGLHQQLWSMTADIVDVDCVCQMPH